MSILITSPLRSQPASIGPGETAQLVLDVRTTASPSETAQIVYRITAAGVTFVQTGTAELRTTEQVFPTGTTNRTSYSLQGPPGGIPIRAEVTPASPPATSGTMVTLKSALVGIAAGSGRGGPLPPPPAPGARKKAAAKKKKAGAAKAKMPGGKSAAKKKAAKTAVKKKAAKKKPAKKAAKKAARKRAASRPGRRR